MSGNCSSIEYLTDTSCSFGFCFSTVKVEVLILRRKSRRCIECNEEFVMERSITFGAAIQIESRVLPNERVTVR